MKKSPRKLVVRSEKLRALATLDLACVVGGESDAEGCPQRLIVQTTVVPPCA